MLAIIPARGGSKGIPNKNLIDLDGKPLIQYTIEAAQKARYITDIFLSSDSDDIISFSKSLGLDVQYKRPDHLATDTASGLDVISDAFLYLKEKGKEPNDFIVLQPTSPLRTSSDIDDAITLFNNSNKKTLLSVSPMLEHPYECIHKKNNDKKTNEWKMLAKNSTSVSRRQDYQDSFLFINGAIYISNTDHFNKENKLIDEGESLLYTMPSERSIDIDTPFDLSLTKFLICNQKN